jgi:hypothetical protein
MPNENPGQGGQSDQNKPGQGGQQQDKPGQGGQDRPGQSNPNQR